MLVLQAVSCASAQPGAVANPLAHPGMQVRKATLPPGILMDVGEMVDAALVGLDGGESVTIPSLPDIADWEAYEATRQNMMPKLSLSSPAMRYRVAASNPAVER